MMVMKIDYVALREAVRVQYADYPADGDEVIEFELPAAAEIIAERSRILARNAMIENDMRTRNLLKRWVSELEPVLFVRAGDWRVFGVGAKGHSEPTILWEDI